MNYIADKVHEKIHYRYYLCAYDTYYPSGGFHDITHKSNNLEDLFRLIQYVMQYEEIVKTSEIRTPGWTQELYKERQEQYQQGLETHTKPLYKMKECTQQIHHPDHIQIYDTIDDKFIFGLSKRGITFDDNGGRTLERNKIEYNDYPELWEKIKTQTP